MQWKFKIATGYVLAKQIWFSAFFRDGDFSWECVYLSYSLAYALISPKMLFPDTFLLELIQICVFYFSLQAAAQGKL